jgi:hypothetical protein
MTVVSECDPCHACGTCDEGIAVVGVDAEPTVTGAPSADSVVAKPAAPVPSIEPEPAPVPQLEPADVAPVSAEEPAAPPYEAPVKEPEQPVMTEPVAPVPPVEPEPAPQPTPEPVAEPEPKAEPEPRPEVIPEPPAVPEPKPEVKPEPAPAPEPKPELKPEPPAPPAEENIFENDLSKADDTPANTPSAKPADEPAAEPEPSAEPAAEPAPEPKPEPSAIDDPFSALTPAPAEPVRRWIDDTGSHDAVGRLVEVHTDHVRILKLDGHFTRVPLDRLSSADRNYVSTTSERLAARPRLTDTAGL